MATLETVLDGLVTFWKNSRFRKNLPWIFLFISFVGSFIKYMELLPDSYFNYKRNVLNVYFVKLAWGWTFSLLLPFIAISSYSQNDLSFVLKRLCSLLVGTVIWYTCTHIFFYIEDLTGACYNPEAKDVILEEFQSKLDCKKGGHQWQGFDISGHSFLLSYSSLLIVEEMAAMVNLKKDGLYFQTYKNVVLCVLYFALQVIIAIWGWMFICTSVYFHNIEHKLLGTACGLLVWYLTYRLWYQKTLSPGLPAQPKDGKQK
ncbi:acyl-coenzyme A diphosphatase FITM2 [Amia ocellicauda]|uniref:acyl-coenzyme A diphosphatase FITM2 n=1 Tax=Amia ocellicauda TaxID=2972642 RepID=UPI0034647822|nr:FITM2 protein [Amia calva]